MTTLGPISIFTGTDDGYVRVTASFNNSGATGVTGNLGGVYDSFFGFRSVSVPQGSTINSATLLIKMGAGGAHSVNWKCRAVAADDQAAPGSRAVYNAFTWTAASVTGTATDDSDLSIDVASIIQELVDRAGWAGDRLVFQLGDNGSAANKYLQPAMYESSTQEARLTIDYTGAGMAPPFRRRSTRFFRRPF